jgi:DNA repair protein RadA/Sms
MLRKVREELAYDQALFALQAWQSGSRWWQRASATPFTECSRWPGGGTSHAGQAAVKVRKRQRISVPKWQCAAKRSVEHVCRECGHTEARRYGRCPCCQSWDSMVEQPRRRREAGGLQRPRDDFANQRRHKLWSGDANLWSGDSDQLNDWLQGAGTAPLPLGILQRGLGPGTEHKVAKASALDGSSSGNASGKLPHAASMESNRAQPVEVHRLLTCSAEFNRVTGGGIVPGSLLLIGGEPGNGKSTLLLQIAGDVASSGCRVLYVSAEESVEQVSSRAARLFGLMEPRQEESTERRQSLERNLLIMHEACLEDILDIVEEIQAGRENAPPNSAPRATTASASTTPTATVPSTGAPSKAVGAGRKDASTVDNTDAQSPLGLLIIDSIQTVYTQENEQESAAPGSIVQVRHCTNRLLGLAKRQQQRLREPWQRTAIMLIGHVTKSGDLAGPKLLEHMVDVVLYLESEQGLFQHRILRCTKNRFGPTDIGIFDLTSRGLVDVPNPSLLYFQAAESSLMHDSDGAAKAPNNPFHTYARESTDGTAFSMVVDGTRAFLVEIQALVAKTSLTQPRRTSNGFDLSRLYVILAVLSKRARLRLETHDVYMNVVGGARIQDPAADMAAAVALASSLLARAPRPDTAFIGELGLQGEVRPVPRLDLRLRDIARLGFRFCVCSDRLSSRQETAARETGLQVIRCRTISQVLQFGIPEEIAPTEQH